MDKEFDAYLNCRAIHSSNVDIEETLREAMRVTRGRIIISIANGYLVDGKIIHGMFDYDLSKIDPIKSWGVKEKVKYFLRNKKNTIKEYSSMAEFFVVAE